MHGHSGCATEIIQIRTQIHSLTMTSQFIKQILFQCPHKFIQDEQTNLTFTHKLIQDAHMKICTHDLNLYRWLVHTVIGELVQRLIIGSKYALDARAPPCQLNLVFPFSAKAFSLMP